MAIGDLLPAGGHYDVDPPDGHRDRLDIVGARGAVFFGAGMLFPLATSGAMEPFPFLAGTAGALVGGLQNIGSGVLAGSRR